MTHRRLTKRDEEIRVLFFEDGMTAKEIRMRVSERLTVYQVYEAVRRIRKRGIVPSGTKSQIWEIQKSQIKDRD